MTIEDKEIYPRTGDNETIYLKYNGGIGLKKELHKI